jgi:ferredoxin
MAAVFKSWFVPSPRFVMLLSQHTLEILPSQTVLECALNHGVHIPHGCRVGACGMCKCRIRSGSVKQHPEVMSRLTAKEKQEGIIYACSSLPLTDLTIELINEE